MRWHPAKWQWLEKEMGVAPCLNTRSAEKGWCPDVPEPPVEMVPAESWTGARRCLGELWLAPLFLPQTSSLKEGNCMSPSEMLLHARITVDTRGPCELQLHEGGSAVIRERHREQPHRDERERFCCWNPPAGTAWGPPREAGMLQGEMLRSGMLACESELSQCILDLERLWRVPMTEDSWLYFLCKGTKLILSWIPAEVTVSVWQFCPKKHRPGCTFEMKAWSGGAGKDVLPFDISGGSGSKLICLFLNCVDYLFPVQQQQYSCPEAISI